MIPIYHSMVITYLRSIIDEVFIFKCYNLLSCLLIKPVSVSFTFYLFNYIFNVKYTCDYITSYISFEHGVLTSSYCLFNLF